MSQQAADTYPRQSPNAHRPRPLSADFLSSYANLSQPSAAGKQSSMLYAILPSAVQRRLPPIPSLRRSVSMYGPTREAKSRSAPGSSSNSRPGTPEETAYGAMVLKETASEDIALFEGRGGPCGQMRIPVADVVEVKSGIGWKYAGQGLSLLNVSLSEASTITSVDMTSDANIGFTRQLYIHAVTYLLQGLPQDLTTEEMLAVRAALPQSLAQPIHITSNANSPAEPTLIQSQPPPPPSLLHRSLANTIVHLFVLFSFLLPYLKLLLRKAHQYERSHHVTETLLRSGLGAVDELGKRGLGVSAAVWGAGVGDLCGWVLEEVGAGVRDGVEGGLGRVRGVALDGGEGFRLSGQ